ncbi:sugar transferase [Terrabacter terrigena]|uniref:Sugar transferase n=1 Tax=Terrabacter terrigena TaxID=574718 RepID=A0ABW3MV61_9MICO
MRHRLLKRTFDLVVAVPVLLLSLPVQAIVALLVRRRLGSPVLFRQERSGLNGTPFTLIKFRTMHAIDPSLKLVDDADRLTDFGRRLRATSLDELPTLWNVLRGDMSVVGPRPLLTQYLPVYSLEHTRRHEVRPGLTGLAQVSGRNSIEWSQRLDLDVSYVRSMSFRTDLKILLKTVKLVLSRTGIEHAGSATYPRLQHGYSSTPPDSHGTTTSA